MYFLWAMIGQNSYPFALLGLLLPSVPTFEVCFLILCFYGRRIKIKIYSPAILTPWLYVGQVSVPIQPITYSN